MTSSASVVHPVPVSADPALEIRKIAVIVEEIHREAHAALERPLRVAAASAVIRNPFAGRFADDISVLPGSFSDELGPRLAALAADALGTEVRSFGKAALVGLGGEVHHGSMVIHTRAFGDPLRELASGAAIVPSAEKRGGGGATLDVPLRNAQDDGTLAGLDISRCSASSCGSATRRPTTRSSWSPPLPTGRVPIRGAGPDGVGELGFIGLGTMGARNARCLLQAGHDLVVYDIDAAAVDALTAAGATTAADPADVARRSDIVFVSLPDSPQVIEAALGEAGIGSRSGGRAGRGGPSTVAPATPQRLAAELAPAGITWLDAPVSGPPAPRPER